jgi:homoserine dehydrogenase
MFDEASQLGYLKTEPELDVGGIDARWKRVKIGTRRSAIFSHEREEPRIQQV